MRCNPARCAWRAPISTSQRGEAERDLAEFGEAFAELLAARAEGAGVTKTRGALAQRLAELKEDGVELLSMPAELMLAVDLGRSYGSHKKWRGGVEEIEVHAPHLPGGELRLALRLPDNYDPRERGWPLVVAIAGEGQRAGDHLRRSWDVAGFREGAVLIALELPAEEKSREEITYRGKPGGVSRVLTALRYAAGEFRIDFDRVFLAGTGEGIPMAFMAASFDPGRFAGIVARAGDLGELDGEPSPENFLATPVWLGATGTNAKLFIEELESLGAEGSERVAGDDPSELWRWMEQNKRDRTAKRVRVTTGNPFPTRVGWLRVTPKGKSCHAEGRIDRAAGRITIESEGVAAVILHLNDELIDLDRPFVVDLDGAEFERQVRPSLSEMVDLLEEGVSDGGRLFTATVHIDPIAVEVSLPAALPEGRDSEFDGLLRAAGEDADALWTLATRWRRDGATARAEVALAKLLRIRPDHAEARKAAGWYGGPLAWFRSREAVRRHMDGQEPEEAAHRGLTEYEGLWVHPDERRLASRGWVKDFGRGMWLSKQDLERFEKGFALQDLTWIEPELADRVDRGLWLVGGEWLELTEANARHARLSSPWRIPTGNLVLNTTLDRETTRLAAHQAERALADVRDVFGVQPVLPIEVAVLGREEQVDRFALGEPDGRRGPRHVGRVHTLGSAFLAEHWFRRVDGELEHTAQGVGLWDPGIEHGAAYGVHSVRFATALSYVEALDPSPMTVRRALAKGVGDDFSENYYAEKRLPAWLRWGAAVYAERFFIDPDANPGEGGNPDWPRVWSLENLNAVDGLNSLNELFAFELSDDRDSSRRLLISAGAAVAFLVRGESQSARAALRQFQVELRAGNLQREDLELLEEALRENEAALRRFCER